MKDWRLSLAAFAPGTSQVTSVSGGGKKVDLSHGVSGVEQTTHWTDQLLLFGLSVYFGEDSSLVYIWSA